jgi:hypothetical protein
MNKKQIVLEFKSRRLNERNNFHVKDEKMGRITTPQIARTRKQVEQTCGAVESMISKEPD